MELIFGQVCHHLPIRWRRNYLMFVQFIYGGFSGGILDYSIDSITDIAQIIAGGTATSTVTINRLNGYALSITSMTVSDVTGLSGSGTIASNADSGTLTVTASSSVSGGTFTATVTLSDGTISHLDTMSVTIVIPVLSVSLTYDSTSSASVSGGGAANITISTATIYTAVTEKVTGTVNYGTPTWSHTVTQSNANATITRSGAIVTCVWAANTAAGNTCSVTLTATVNSIAYSRTLTFNVIN